MTRSRDVADTQDNSGGAVPPITAGKNAIINGGFDIWQRGTSIAQAGGFSYSADRWVSARNGFDVGTTMSRQLTGDTTNLPFIQYCGRVQRNSGTTATTGVFFSQSIESINSIPFMGKTITFSFYARAGANYSSASNALTVKVDTGTGTDQSIINTWTGGASAIGGNQTATLTTTWQRFTYTGTASASGTQLGFYFSYTPVGTAGANDWFEVTGVQLEVGSVATPFSRNAGTIQGELAACQYYFNRLAGEGTYQQISNGQCWSSTDAMATVNYPIMRVAPTITYSTASFFSLQNATNTEVAITALASYNIRKTSYKPNMTVASGLVAGNATLFQTRSTGTVGTLDLSAEL
jgi:hypothetical protein